MHIYMFGSLCRGEVSRDSDIDLLAITSGFDSRFNPEIYSIYSYGKIRKLWKAGNPFAWHLFLESRLAYASDGLDFIRSLGRPDAYTKCADDCQKFFLVFCRARDLLLAGSDNTIFELSNIFLGIRNAATCYSLGMLSVPTFSRRSALEIGQKSLSIPEPAFNVLERARILSTRGKGNLILESEVDTALQHLDQIMGWLEDLVQETRKHG